jgi:hypothetical protein
MEQVPPLPFSRALRNEWKGVEVPRGCRSSGNGVGSFIRCKHCISLDLGINHAGAYWSRMFGPLRPVYVYFFCGKINPEICAMRYIARGNNITNDYELLRMMPFLRDGKCAVRSG